MAIIHYSDKGDGNPADVFGVTVMDAEDYPLMKQSKPPVYNVDIHREESRTIEAQLASAMRRRQVGEPDTWFGPDVASWADAVGLLERGWESGARKTTELAIELSGKVRAHEGFRRRLRRADEGDELNADAALRGDWDTAWLSMHKRRVNGASNIVTLGCAFGANAIYDAESIFWCGAQMLVIADLLENAGYQTEIVGLLNIRHGKHMQGKPNDHKSHECHYLHAVYVKRAGEPLRPDLLASLFANAGLFRTFTFDAILKSHCFVQYGMGSANNSVGQLEMQAKKAHAAGMLPEVDVVVGSAFTRDAAVANIMATIRAVTGEDMAA